MGVIEKRPDGKVYVSLAPETVELLKRMNAELGFDFSQAVGNAVAFYAGDVLPDADGRYKVDKPPEW